MLSIRDRAFRFDLHTIYKDKVCLRVLSFPGEVLDYPIGVLTSGHEQVYRLDVRLCLAVIRDRLNHCVPRW